MAGQLGVAVLDTAIDLSGLRSGLAAARPQVESQTKTIGKGMGQSLGAGFMELWAKTQIASMVLTPLRQIAQEAIGLASAAEESWNLVSVTFGENAEAIKAWAAESSASLVQTEVTTARVAGVFYGMLSNMGVASDAALDMSKSMTELTGDMASFFNLSPDEAFLKLRAAISGEFEPLRQLGIVINETTIRQQALNMQLEGATNEVLPASTKALATYALVMRQTENAQGDLIRTQDGFENSSRALKKEWDELLISFGKGFVGSKDTAEAFKILKETIQNMVASGTLTQVGEDLGEIAHATAELIRFMELASRSLRRFQQTGQDFLTGGGSALLRWIKDFREGGAGNIIGAEMERSKQELDALLETYGLIPPMAERTAAATEEAASAATRLGAATAEAGAAADNLASGYTEVAEAVKSAEDMWKEAAAAQDTFLSAQHDALTKHIEEQEKEAERRREESKRRREEVKRLQDEFHQAIATSAELGTALAQAYASGLPAVLSLVSGSENLQRLLLETNELQYVNVHSTAEWRGLLEEAADEVRKARLWLELVKDSEQQAAKAAIELANAEERFKDISEKAVTSLTSQLEAVLSIADAARSGNAEAQRYVALNQEVFRELDAQLTIQYELMGAEQQKAEKLNNSLTYLAATTDLTHSLQFDTQAVADTVGGIADEWDAVTEAIFEATNAARGMQAYQIGIGDPRVETAFRDAFGGGKGLGFFDSDYRNADRELLRRFDEQARLLGADPSNYIFNSTDPNALQQELEKALRELRAAQEKQTEDLGRKMDTQTSEIMKIASRGTKNEPQIVALHGDPQSQLNDLRAEGVV